MKARMNEKGIALIIALITALIILILGSIALYVSIKSTKISGSFRQHRASIQSAKGGYEKTKYIIDYIKVHSTAPSISDGNFTNFTNFKDKVSTPTAGHPTLWTDDAQNPDKTVSNYDIKLDIGDYYVYVKLTNTAIGNTALGGSKTLGTGGVTTGKAGASTVTPPKIPYLYTLKIVSKHKTTNDEAAVSLLYGY